MHNLKVDLLKIAILIAKLQSIAISIAKTQSIAILCKLLESPMQNTKGIIIVIAEYPKCCNTHCKFPKDNNKHCIIVKEISKKLQYLSQNCNVL